MGVCCMGVLNAWGCCMGVCCMGGVLCFPLKVSTLPGATHPPSEHPGDRPPNYP